MLCVVRYAGGLGNQMFQYVFCQRLLEKGHVVKCHIEDRDKFCLDRVFGIYVDEASFDELKRTGVREKGKILRKIWLIKKHLGWFNYCSQGDEDVYNFDQCFMNITTPTYFEGFWQNHNYADAIKEKLYKVFSFLNVDTLDESNEKIYRLIEETNSVSVHVRRGDYLCEGNEKFQGLCDAEYYKRAVEYVKRKLSKVIFFIFSDDIEWCKFNLGVNENTVFVEGNVGIDKHYIDMFLMSHCKHNIIANSSYSYWGAYLNRNPGKIVICPSKFLNIPSIDGNGCPEDWIRV